MNKIYKTVWNGTRRCLMVVNESTKSHGKTSVSSGSTVCVTRSIKRSAITLAVLMALSWQGSAFAKDYKLEAGKNYTFGVLTDVDNFSAIGVQNVTIEGINAPNGLFNFQELLRPDATKDPETGKYLSDDYYYPIVTVESDAILAGLRTDGTFTINGNLTVIGDKTTEEYRQIIQQRIDENTASSLIAGNLILEGNENRPITINGDVRAPIVDIRSIGIRSDEPASDYWGYTVINGNLYADYLSTDNYAYYDDMTDYLEVNGTVTVSQMVINNGSMNVDKLIVQGTFYNGNGTYTGTGEGNPLELVGATIGELDATNIMNGSNLYVGTITNDSGQTYTQTFGTIQVQNNWFKDSTINMSGGIIDEALLGPDKNLGINNVFNVSGGTLRVSDLNFESTVKLTDQGKIETQLESIFVNPDGDPEALNYVGLNNQSPQTIQSSMTKWFVNYAPGTLRTDLEDHVNFEGGSIVVSGFGTITQNQYDDLLTAFKGAF